MQNITFDGRLGKDAEILTTKNGVTYVRFSVANNTFDNGSEKTEWYDVTSYDPYVIEKRVQYLTKGTYVIVTGPIRFDVSIKDGRVYKNLYVNAKTIDTPVFGKKDDDTSQVQSNTQTKPQAVVQEQQISTYTPQTSVVAQPQQTVTVQAQQAVVNHAQTHVANNATQSQFSEPVMPMYNNSLVNQQQEPAYATAASSSGQFQDESLPF